MTKRTRMTKSEFFGQFNVSVIDVMIDAAQRCPNCMCVRSFIKDWFLVPGNDETVTIGTMFGASEALGHDVANAERKGHEKIAEGLSYLITGVTKTPPSITTRDIVDASMSILRLWMSNNNLNHVEVAIVDDNDEIGYYNESDTAPNFQHTVKRLRYTRDELMRLTFAVGASDLRDFGHTTINGQTLDSLIPHVVAWVTKDLVSAGWRLKGNSNEDV